jgi:FAD/FMN-containing dehydrogenase/Fe-S oxidoreductase
MAAAPHASPADADVEELAAALRREVRGEVRFDRGSRALYATDASNYRQVPIGVVVPRDADDVLATLAACRQAGAPVLGRGGGTSLAGQCCNTAVLLDFSKYMNKVVELDPERRIARVQPGIVLDRLREAAEVHHLTYGPDPATHAWCTLGGMIGNNSCGVHALMAGKTEENIEALDVVTYDGLRLQVGPTSDRELEAIVRAGGRRGELYAGMRAIRDRHAELIRARYPDIPRRVSGYNLPELLPENGFHVARALVGTESTCAITLEATVRLVASPQHRRLVVLGYPDIYTAGDHIPEVLEFGPVGLEGMDVRLIEYMRQIRLNIDKLHLLPDGGGWLIAELGADTPEEVDAKVDRMVARLRKAPHPPSIGRYHDPHDERAIWEIRESGLGATAYPPGQLPNYEGWEDSAVDPARVGAYMRDLTALWDRYGYVGSLYGHVGQGCLHTRNNFDFRSEEGIRRYRAFMEEAADLCVAYGGSLSGEHGEGQQRGELLGKMFGEELVDAFRDFKRLWDPDWKLNPGKVVDPYPLDWNLRLGPAFRPRDLGPTHFSYRATEGRFQGAVLRCVGVSKCRRETGGTMCPSYMVTKEERHSTRGRARMLFEMLQGEVVTDGWHSDEVREALDLCISCKGCKGDCPVSVDMATYKAEFLSHYYKRRLRPRHAYSIGLIWWAARAASKAPRLVNAVTHAPLLAPAVKWLGGIDQQRQIPRFAAPTFRRWFAAREPRNLDGPPVLLWPDTFNNYLDPEVARAAVEVLEDAGYQVRIPERILCCGRPLYDFGMLGLAKRLLRQVLDAIRPAIRDGIPVVGLEPSCVAVFRDELVNLFPDDKDARRLAGQTFTLAELLADHTDGWRPPPLSGRAIVHGHCHQKAVIGMDPDLRLLRGMGLDAELLDSGCCGLAGPFGFEAGRYQISMAMGERALLPRVRDADPDTLVLADGFSCATQVRDATGRRTLHLAEVLRLGLHDGRAPAAPAPTRRPSRRVLALGAGGSVLVALGGMLRRRQSATGGRRLRGFR